VGLRDKYTDMMNFDLAKFNWLGWLLLLGTFGFAIAGALVLAYATYEQPVGQSRGVMKALAIVMVALSIGFFFGCRWLLNRAGLSIYRKKKKRRRDDDA
jgi:hypothetical protein